MAVSLGTIYADLGIRMDQFSKGLGQAEAKVNATAERLQATSERLSGVGNTLLTGVTLPILAIGAGITAIGMSMDNALDTIRAGTGATGAELKTLEEDFKAVFTGVPQNATVVSTAIKDLNTRLGLSGKPLQDMSTQMLNLSRLTGKEVAPLIASTTRVFGDWGVATKDQSRTLDTLFKVSQNTGIGVDTLAQKTVQFGAPLRAMGFSLEESAAKLGKWEKEGVNAELVLGSMRIGMGHFADAGIPMREGLDQTMAKIKKLGPGAEATSLAMEVFGARAGPDMAAAILEGRFEIDEMMKTLEGSSETINKAAEDTMGFEEKVLKLRNEVMVALGPLGELMLGLFERFIPYAKKAAEYVARLAEDFANLSPKWQNIILLVIGLIAAIGPLLLVFGALFGAIAKISAGMAAIKTSIAAFKTSLGILKGALGGSKVAMAMLKTSSLKLKIAFWVLKGAALLLKGALLILKSPIVLVIAIIAALAFGVYMLIKHWDVVSEFFSNLWDTVKKIFAESVDAVVKAVQILWDDAVSWFTSIVESVSLIIARVKEAITAPFRLARDAAIEVIQRLLDGAVRVFALMVDGIRTALAGVVEFITAPFRLARDAVMAVVQWLSDNAVGRFALMVDGVRTIIARVIEFITAPFRLARDAVMAVVQWLSDNAVGRFSSMVDGIRTALAGVREAITAPFRRAREAVTDIVDGIRSRLDRLNPFARSSPSLVDQVRAGVAAIQSEYDKLERLRLPTLAFETPAIPTYIGRGHDPARAETGATADAIGKAVYAAVKDALKVSSTEQTRAGGGSQEVVLEIDGSKIARAVLPALIHEEQRLGVKLVGG